MFFNVLMNIPCMSYSIYSRRDENRRVEVLRLNR